MQYKVFRTIAAAAEAELTEQLFAFGAESVSTEESAGETVITALFSEVTTAKEFILANGFSVEELKEEEWKYSWLQWYEGGELTPSIYLQPFNPEEPQLKESGYRYTVNLDPRDAFGDGRHPTTRQCARFLERELENYDEGEREKLRLLDAGTGTGLLAIIGAMMGVGTIEAIDIEKESIERTGENCRHNGFAGIELACSDIAGYGEGSQFDLVCANLLTDIILKNINHLASLTALRGKLIISGVSEEWSSQVEEAAMKTGLRLLEKSVEDGWCCFLFTI